jgi:hypothetical protein
MTESQARKLVEAVKNWLDFQILCKRDMLLSENYLAQPVGEYLKAIHNHGIQTEWNHPAFHNAKRGRPRQIDYAILSRNNKRLLAAIEAKWVGKVQSDKQRIINDIMRLECIRSEDGQWTARYLLIAGLTENYKNNLLDIKLNMGTTKARSNFIDNILPNQIGNVQLIKVRQAENVLKTYFKEYADGYNVPIPISFKTKLIADSCTENVRVAVWKISSSRKRKTFNHSSEWISLSTTAVTD